jgi:hypothetical protein
MVVALGALEIHTEEHPAHVAGHARVVRRLLPYLVEAVGGEKAGARLGGLEEIGAEDLARHDVPWLPRAASLLQVVPPRRVFAASLHEHDVQRLREAVREASIGENAVQQRLAFSRRGIGEESPHLGGGRDFAREIEAGAADQLRIAGLPRDRLRAAFRVDQPIDLQVQGLPGSERRGEKRDEPAEREPTEKGGAGKHWGKGRTMSPIHNPAPGNGLGLSFEEVREGEPVSQ